jgi:hypothetical protein
MRDQVGYLPAEASEITRASFSKIKSSTPSILRDYVSFFFKNKVLTAWITIKRKH